MMTIMTIIMILFLIIFILSCLLLWMEISEDEETDKESVQRKTEAVLREMNRNTFKAQKEMIREALRSMES